MADEDSPIPEPTKQPMKDLWSDVIRRDWAPMALALIITGGFLLVMRHLFSNAIPEGNRELVLSMVDTLKTVWVLACGYFFGSTIGSSQKNELLARSIHPDNKP